MQSIPFPRLAAMFCITVCLLSIREAPATVLTFAWGTGGALETHGDRATAEGNEPHLYEFGKGWTPNVTVSYDNTRTTTWTGPTSSQKPALRSLGGTINIDFEADEGWDVVIDSFKVWGFRSNLLVDAATVRPIDGGNGVPVAGRMVLAGLGRIDTVIGGEETRGPRQRLVIRLGSGPDNSRILVDDIGFYQVPSGVNLGDADRDGAVGLADFNILKNNFGTDFGTHEWDKGDFNSDWLVDIGDFAILKENFGRTSQTPASVPEPSGFVLGAIGLMAAGFALYCKRQTPVD